MNLTKTIVLVGGGFAGTTLARALDGKLPPDYRLLLISEESHFQRSHELDAAEGSPASVNAVGATRLVSSIAA